MVEMEVGGTGGVEGRQDLTITVATTTMMVVLEVSHEGPEEAGAEAGAGTTTRRRNWSLVACLNHGHGSTAASNRQSEVAEEAEVAEVGIEERTGTGVGT